MNKLKSRIQLLSLFSIYFIYKAISSFLAENTFGFYFWLAICIIYFLSLGVMYFVYGKKQKTEANKSDLQKQKIKRD
ncbi:MAG: hypothetical protein R6U96_00565 [Promethearchaeia archaeon]